MEITLAQVRFVSLYLKKTIGEKIGEDKWELRRTETVKGRGGSDVEVTTAIELCERFTQHTYWAVVVHDGYLDRIAFRESKAEAKGLFKLLKNWRRTRFEWVPLFQPLECFWDDLTFLKVDQSIEI